MAARSTSTLSLSARSPRSLDAVAVALARPAATCAHGQRGGSSGSGAARARAARAESRWQAAARSQSLAGAVAVAASGSLAGGVAESGAGGGHRSQRAGQERTDRRRPGVLRLDARGPWPVLSRAPVLDEVQPWSAILDPSSIKCLDQSSMIKCLDQCTSIRCAWTVTAEEARISSPRSLHVAAHRCTHCTLHASAHLHLHCTKQIFALTKQSTENSITEKLHAQLHGYHICLHSVLVNERTKPPNTQRPKD